MKKTTSAAMLIAGALCVAACSKSEEAPGNATTEAVTLNEGEVAETNFTDANLIAADDAATDNGTGIGGNDTAQIGNEAGAATNIR